MSAKPPIFLGVDTGLDGAFAALTVTAGHVTVIHLATMPTVARDETPADLRARGVRQLEEQRAIAETLAQSWPRLDGETPDPAVHWQAAGFCDAEVVAWLEVGVPWVGMALELREAGVEPRAVGREWESGCTLGLAFARGDVSLARALAEVER